MRMVPVNWPGSTEVNETTGCSTEIGAAVPLSKLVLPVAVAIESHCGSLAAVTTCAVQLIGSVAGHAAKVIAGIVGAVPLTAAAPVTGADRTTRLSLTGDSTTGT